MRIAGNTAMRRYVNNLQRNFHNKNLSENKIIANRKFTRASQSPLDAAKALKVRKSMSEIETYQRNLEAAAGVYDAAEGAVLQVSGIMQTLHEKLIAGATGTFALHPDKQIIAEEIDQMAKQMVSLMNLNAAGRRIFGGTSNSDLQAFENSNGTILFNGVPVDSFNDHTQFPFGGSGFFDVGLGMSWLDDYTINPQTAIASTFNGAQIMGSGVNPAMVRIDIPAGAAFPTDLNVTVGNVTHTITGWDGTADNLQTLFNNHVPPVAINVTNAVGGQTLILTTAVPEQPIRVEGVPDPVTGEQTVNARNFPQNIIQLTLEAAAAVRTGDNTLIMQYSEMLLESQKFLMVSIAQIGSTTQFIEFNQERLANNMLSLQEQQNILEHPDLGEEITRQKVLEMIYNATLQMSAQTIPMSIFNFMR
jgi:flagellin-like hook-associated protein FlgL